MVKWFTVLDTFLNERPTLVEFCQCDEREEGACLCEECWKEVRGWHRWMEGVSDGP